MSVPWWAWVALAVLFGVLEVALPVSAFLGFAVGAAAVGALLLLGATPGIGAQLLLFAVVSAAAFVLLRLLLGRAGGGGSARVVERDINDHR